MKRSIATFLPLALASLLLLVACGSDNSSSTAPPSPTYTGVTTQAAFTPANTQQLTVGAVNGGMAGENIISTLGTASTGAPAGAPALLNLVERLQALFAGGLPGQAVPAINVTQTFTGSCGGQAVRSMDLNVSTGSFTGTLTFSDYCEAGLILSGTVPFTGNMNLSTGELQHLALSLSSLQVTSSATGAAQNLSGPVTWDVSADGQTETVTMNLVLQDATSGKTYWASNYLLKIVSDTTGATDTTASGRYYDHDNGYVDFTTTTPLHLDSSAAAGPSAGVLHFTGNGGTSALVSIQADGSYLIEADTTGDGAYDFTATYTP